MDNANPQVSIQVNVGLHPFGQSTVDFGYAHPDRFPDLRDNRIALTQVVPLMSSVATPGYARPASA